MQNSDNSFLKNRYGQRTIAAKTDLNFIPFYNSPIYCIFTRINFRFTHSRQHQAQSILCTLF
jgi:hypothetical protein